jgi:hypothetical protein
MCATHGLCAWCSAPTTNNTAAQLDERLRDLPTGDGGVAAVRLRVRLLQQRCPELALARPREGEPLGVPPRRSLRRPLGGPLAGSRGGRVLGRQTGQPGVHDGGLPVAVEEEAHEVGARGVRALCRWRQHPADELRPLGDDGHGRQEPAVPDPPLADVGGPAAVLRRDNRPRGACKRG